MKPALRLVTLLSAVLTMSNLLGSNVSPNAFAQPPNPQSADGQAENGQAASKAADADLKNGQADFESQVLALLKSRCFECHGQDAREGGLRLTSRNDLMLRNDSGEPAIVSGNSKASELIRRVTSRDDDRMPPEGSPLTREEVQILEQWINTGADWTNDEAGGPTHWAYIAPIKAEVAGSAHPVDFFVKQELADHPSGLQPCPPESPARLLRRVYLDLTGLPPSPEAVAAFEADPSAEHFEQIVDSLLASPRYGEKWARQWLDLARYADSNGYQADQFRSVWAYRDWVIEAMNSDMPFDQFTIEQLAGDLLPNATIKQKIATGFHRQTTCNVEAGVDPEENRSNQVADRVTTTGTVWLGTTLECARCHNHKYDPFTQQDFYQLFAFFNNTPLEVEQQGDGVQFEVAGPMIDLPLPTELQQQQEELQHQLKQLRTHIKQRTQELPKVDNEWESALLASASQQAEWHPLTISHFEATSKSQFEHLNDGSLLLKGKAADKDTYTVTIDTRITGITGLKLETLTHESLPGHGPGRTDDKRPNIVLYEVETRIAPLNSPNESNPTAVQFRSATADYAQPNWDPAGLIDGKSNTGWAIGTQFGKPHEVTLLTESPIGFPDGSQLTIRLPQHFGRGRLIGRLRLSALTGNPSAATVPSNVLAVIAVSVDERTEAQSKALTDYRIATDKTLAELTSQTKSIETSLATITPASTAVMTEMDEARPSFIFKRGDFLTHGPEVKPWTPTVLHSFEPHADRAPVADGERANRLDLARWIVARDNPLTARVTVNRWWSEFFGQGIVDTLEDFGTQGSRPSHPQLLDWLAVEFMDQGWSMKRIHKLIVTSATYQQSSRITPVQLEADPYNKLLARGPRFRLSAEVIRDNALAISGLLSEKMGGPPVYPPQPANIWRHVGRNAPKYETDTDEDRFRRGIYVVWRRSAPYASFVNFDAPDRASCVVNRSRSNTPLQALTLMNDPAYVEMAIALASRIVHEVPNSNLRSRMEYAVRLCVARTPQTEELIALQDLWQQEHDRFDSDIKQAESLIPRKQRLTNTPLPEQAAWFAVANVLLNLDEVITKN